MFPSNLNVRILHLMNRMENRIKPLHKSEFMTDPVLGWYFNLITTVDHYVHHNVLIFFCWLHFYSFLNIILEDLKKNIHQEN